MSLIYTGHVGIERRGNDLYLQCDICKAEELVLDYENGGTPQKFSWFPLSLNGTEYSKCHSCGKVHEKVVPYAR